MAKAKKKSTNPVNEKWFKDQLKKLNPPKGMSQRQAAIKLDINQATITQMFKGKRKMPLEESYRWAELLGCPVEDVMANVGIDVPDVAPATKSQAGKVAIEGWADGELIIHREAGLKGSKFAPNPGTTSTNVRCVRCQTSGSKFEGWDGALVYYNEAGGFDPDALSRLCVVKVKGKESEMIRTVKRGYESGKHNLALPNGDMSEENVVIESASPILWMKL